MKLETIAGPIAGLLAFAAAAWAQPPVVSAPVSANSFGYAGRSPELGVPSPLEGIAANGTNYFLIYRRQLLRVDATWTNVLARNDDPFSGLTGYDHLGAGECYEGKLYVTGESYHGCSHVTNQSLFLFDATDLRRIAVTVVSNHISEVSAVTILPEAGAQGVVFVSNFCDASRLYKFNLADLSYLGTVPLSRRIPKIQGLAWNGRWIYTVADRGTNGVVHAVDPDTGRVRKITSLTFPHGREVEGCFYRNGRLAIMVASHTNRFNYVYSFTP